VWLGSKNDGLFKLATKKNFQQTLPLYSFDQNPEQANNILTLCETDSEAIWLGTPDGIFLFENGKTESYPLLTDFGKSVSAITALHEDLRDWLWIGTGGSGIFIWDKKTNRIFNYKADN